MSNPRIPKDRSYTVAAWVAMDLAPWKRDETCEWTYKRDEGDLTVYAKTKEDALLAISAHGFRNLDPDKCRKTSYKLSEHIKRNEIK